MGGISDDKKHTLSTYNWGYEDVPFKIPDQTYKQDTLVARMASRIGKWIGTLLRTRNNN